MLIRLDLIQHLLVAWSPSDWLQLTYVHETGIWQTVSRNMEVFRYRDVHVLARTIILEGGGETRLLSCRCRSCMDAARGPRL